MKRRLYWIIPLAICAVAAIWRGHEIAARISTDGPPAELMGLFADTRYAKGYTISQ